jgi:hypothetical protein
MKRFFLLCCVGFFALPAFALERIQVKYVGGTLPGMNVGKIGTIDISGASLLLESSGHKVAIPYTSIESFEHSTEVARHLGVLPAIVVGLLKARQRRHFIGISYRDPTLDPVTQVVVLEVPKGMSRTVQRVLETRAPRHTQMPNHPCASSSD